MTSVDFAAAQERVRARQTERRIEAETRSHVRQSTSPLHPLTRLPSPLGLLGGRALSAWDTIRGRDGTRPTFRVGQVDAELLDEELLDLLMGQVGDSLKFFGPHLRDDWSQEIGLLLRSILFKLSIWDNNASYGATLQDLSYIDARNKGLVDLPPTKWQKTSYGLITVFGRYTWSKWEEWLLSQENMSDETTFAPKSLATLSKITSLLSNAHSVAAFASFLIFLVNGRYRTLTDRLLRIRLVPPPFQVRREVSFEYLNRQLVWHAFTEFLLFLLPLVGIRRWRRWITTAWSKTKSALRNTSEKTIDDTKRGELGFLPERVCAICYYDQTPVSSSGNETQANAGAFGGIVGSAQTDVTNPYQTTCGCVYCFVCIATRLEAEEGQGWTCLRCGERTSECFPWDGDVVRNRNSKGTLVTFADPDDPEADSNAIT